MKTAGIDATWNFWTRSSFPGHSISAFTIFTFFHSLSAANSSITGQSILQGPHHSAQKSKITTQSKSIISDLN
jgi:hypothetical protein